MQTKRCLIDGCDSKPVARGLCNRHYYAAKRAGTLEELAPQVHRECEQCGKALPAAQRYGARFCSVPCKEASRAARIAAEIERKKLGRVCVQCFRQIPNTRNNKATTCSRECSVKYRNAQKQRDREAGRDERAPCPRCGAPIPEDRRWGSLYCSASCKKLAAATRWRARSPGYMRRYNYGMAQEEYAARLEAQGNRCAICRTDAWGGKDNVPHVDHDHETNAVRGLLCAGCNNGLGNFKDDPVRLRAALRYLDP